MANYYLDTEFLEGTQTKRFLNIKLKPNKDEKNFRYNRFNIMDSYISSNITL
jgi:hypothetical protein